MSNGKTQKTYLEPCNLLLNIVLEQIAEPFPVPVGQLAQFPLKHGLVKDFRDAHTTARLDHRVTSMSAVQHPTKLTQPQRTKQDTHSLGAVARSDTPSCSSNLALAQLDLLETVDGGVQIKVDLATVADKDAVTHTRQTLGLELLQLGEEGRHVEDDARADQVHAFRVDEARGQEVEVVRDALGDDRVSGIMTAL